MGAEKLCLWQGRALFIGLLPPLDFHEQAAILYCVGLEGDFSLTRKGLRQARCRSARIAPKTSHALDVEGKSAAFLFLDPEWDDDAHSEPITTTLDGESKLIAEFLAVARAENDQEVQIALRNLTLSGATLACEERILKITRMIIDAPDGSIPLEELAAAAGVSTSRLAHLFKEQVGVPIRSFKIWYRLKKAVRLLKEGQSLTGAALRAGFYDSSHFANTFRETFGINPSAVFATGRKLHWFVE